MYFIFVSVLVSTSGIYGRLVVENIGERECPLWQVRRKDICRCGANLNGIITCVGTHSISLLPGYCMTWDNTTQSTEINRCPFLQISNVCKQHKLVNTPLMTTNISGSELNYRTCSSYNRHGAQCRQCIDGYGPAAFSDGVTCADCSKHKHMWILNLLFQLTMVTLMYLMVILFQIKGTSSPFNVTITYTRLCINAFMNGNGLRLRLLCFLDPNLTIVILTFFGVWNLDFLRFVIPPLCISKSFKSIDSLLFDHIIALYPIALTLFIYVSIELHDRNFWIVAYLTIPVKKLFKLLHVDWNPKTTILNTCATFLLLAYSKLLFVSINLLIAVHSFNSSGEMIPNSTVLLYDPAVRFFHSEHIPYVVLALSVIVIFILLPPLLLLLYPAQFFRKCLSCCGFRRWDILQFIIDIFQGWFKDGTEGTHDYRPLSALYLLLRIVFSCMIVVIVLDVIHSNVNDFWGWYVVGLFHVFLGTFFFIAKPYKKNWMNSLDGLILTLVGAYMLTEIYENHSVFIVGTIVVVIVFMSICLASIHRYLKEIAAYN